MRTQLLLQALRLVPAIAGGYGAFTQMVVTDAETVGAVAADVARLAFVVLFAVGLAWIAFSIWIVLRNWAVGRQAASRGEAELLDVRINARIKGLRSRLAGMSSHNPVYSPLQRNSLLAADAAMNMLRRLLLQEGHSPPPECDWSTESVQTWYAYLLELRENRTLERQPSPGPNLAVLAELRGVWHERRR